MKIISDTLIPKEIFTECFACDLSSCKGICCVEGDAGAPLTEEEISLLEDYLDRIKPFMVKGGVDVVERSGVFDWDEDGQYVTPLVNDQECAFAIFDGDIALCAIEKAFEAGHVPIQKPESCHLYPIRLVQLDIVGMTKLVYHRWHICNYARENGIRKGVPLLKFLEKPLENKFGTKWLEDVKKISEEKNKSG